MCREAFGEEDPEIVDEFEASIESDAALPGFGMVAMVQWLQAREELDWSRAVIDFDPGQC